MQAKQRNKKIISDSEFSYSQSALIAGDMSTVWVNQGGFLIHSLPKCTISWIIQIVIKYSITLLDSKWRKKWFLPSNILNIYHSHLATLAETFHLLSFSKLPFFSNWLPTLLHFSSISSFTAFKSIYVQLWVNHLYPPFSLVYFPVLLNQTIPHTRNLNKHYSSYCVQYNCQGGKGLHNL